MNDTEKLGVALAIIVGVILYFNLICFIISVWSGWRTLAKRFRHDYDSRHQIGLWKSARFRWGCHYNNALKIAANSEGLWLTTIAIVLQHPPLLIPWSEIRVVKRSTMLWWTFVQLELGVTERIPFTIYESLFTEINRQGQLDATNLW